MTVTGCPAEASTCRLAWTLGNAAVEPTTLTAIEPVTVFVPSDTVTVAVDVVPRSADGSAVTVSSDPSRDPDRPPVSPEGPENVSAAACSALAVPTRPARSWVAEVPFSTLIDAPLKVGGGMTIGMIWTGIGMNTGSEVPSDTCTLITAVPPAVSGTEYCRLASSSRCTVPWLAFIAAPAGTCAVRPASTAT